MPGRSILAALSAPGAVFLLLFFFLPLAVLAIEAFESGGAAFGRLFADPVFWKGLRGSLMLGIAAPGLSLVVGFLIALYLARIQPGRRTSLLFLISLPLTFSGLIVAYGFILVFGRAGFVTLLLAELGGDPAAIGAFIYSPYGLGFAYSYYLIPRVVMVLLPVLVNFDMSQIKAAQSLGAGSFRAHWDVLVMQVLPSAIAAFCLTAAVAIGAYGTALALVGTQVNILPLVLYSKISETGSDFPAAAALSIILMAITTLIMGGAETLNSMRTSPSHDERS